MKKIKLKIDNKLIDGIFFKTRAAAEKFLTKNKTYELIFIKAGGYYTGKTQDV